MKRITLFPLLLLCHLLIAQSFSEAYFPATDLIEVAKYQKFANPTIVGQIGENDYVLIRKMVKSGKIESNLVQLKGRELVKELKLESNISEVEYITNGKIFEDKLILYGYKYSDNQEAEIFYRVLDSGLNPLSDDQIVSKVQLNSDWRKIGAQKNQMTNLGAIEVAPAIFSSDVYTSGEENFEIWFSSLSNSAYEKTNETPFLTKIEFGGSGQIRSKKMFSTKIGEESGMKISHNEVNNIRFLKRGETMYIHIEACWISYHLGQNVYDDYRFPYIANFRAIVLKFEEDGLVAHLYPKGYNHQTSTLIDSGKNLHLIGFYGRVSKTLWTGAYSIKMDYDLQPLSEQYLPLEEHFNHDELKGSKSYTMPALAKESQGIMRNPHVEIFEDGSMVLLGELTTQIIQERSPITNDFIRLDDDKYGKRVTSGFTPDRVHSVKHYFNKIVVLGLDNTGHYSGKVEVINKKQFGLGVRPDKIGYSCTGNGDILTVRFNESRKALKKGYFEKKGGYKSEVKKDQILQEFRFDNELNFEQIIYPNRGEKTLVPMATFRSGNSWRELYTDEKKYYLFAQPK